MRRHFLFVTIFFALCLNASSAYADGWQFANGRFPQGKVTVLELTKSQKALLDLIWECRNNKNNERTPFVFKLTLAQSKKLKKEAGFAPSRFAIFESYKGDVDFDIEINIVNRFSESKFEVPHKLLTRDAEAKDWEINTMGWKANPLNNIKQKDITPSLSCP